MEETGWVCPHCGHFNTGYEQCRKRFRESEAVSMTPDSKGVLNPKNHKVSVSEVTHFLNIIDNPPNLRKQPKKSDLKGGFNAWFDGGAIRVDTGINTYFFDDKTVIHVVPVLNRISISIEFPDGESVEIRQLEKRERRSS
jgi:hypothetical protein